MSLDNSTRTFADIEGPVDSTVPSGDFYLQRKMALQYRALRNATCNPYFKANLQALIEHVYLQYLPYNIFLPQNQAIWEIANIGYEFCFSTFDLGHLATRDPESGKLSTFFDTPMHLAVIEHMSGGNKNYKPSSAAGVRIPDGVLVAYCVHKKSEFPTFPPSPILIPTTLKLDRQRPSRRFLDMIDVDHRDEDSLVTAVTSLILEIKAEGRALIDGWIQLCGYSLSSFQACRCRWGVFQRGARFGRLMVLGEVSEEGIAIEYRDPARDCTDDSDDDEPPKILHTIDKLHAFLKSPNGIGTLPHRLFTPRRISSNGDLDPAGVKVAHVTIQMGVDLIKTLPIDRPLGPLPDLPDSDLLSSLLSTLKVHLKEMTRSTHYDIAARLRKTSMSSQESDEGKRKAEEDLRERMLKKGGPSVSGRDGSFASAGGTGGGVQDAKEGVEEESSDGHRTTRSSSLKSSASTPSTPSDPPSPSPAKIQDHSTFNSLFPQSPPFPTNFHDDTNQDLIHFLQDLSFQNKYTSTTIQDVNVASAKSSVLEQCSGDDGEGFSNCGESYKSESHLSTDEECMDREEKSRLKEEEDKAYVEAVWKVLREKRIPFFLLSPSQFDKLSGSCTHV
ncbi:hypothetical protein I315_05505 [Cryptococcus gattii Ru294]|nr:hypothetical protein I315_05505 [Cryptococcus gattii Ru294]